MRLKLHWNPRVRGTENLVPFPFLRKNGHSPDPAYTIRSVGLLVNNAVGLQEFRKITLDQNSTIILIFKYIILSKLYTISCSSGIFSVISLQRSDEFYIFCTVLCNVTTQYKPTKCNFAKLIF
jgi:hypothetical protein